MNKKYVITILLTIVLIIISGLAIYRQLNRSAVVEKEFIGSERVEPLGALEQTPTVTPEGVTSYTEVGPVADAAQREQSILVIYGDAGFSPDQIKVRKGGLVTFVNDSPRPMWVASDSHPTHTDLLGFDQKQGVGQQGNYSYTFTQAGNWKYHNHLNSGDEGMVIVE